MSFLFPSPFITTEAALRDLAQGSPKARVAAAHALGDVREVDARPTAARALVTALDDDRADVRAEACQSLAALEVEEPKTIAAIIKRLDDGEALVRQAAAIALGSLRAQAGFAALATALREGPPDLRFQAATSLVEIDAAAALAPLLAAIGDRDPQVVSAVALALGAVADGKATTSLVGLLSHATMRVRFDAAYALAELGDARGAEVLIDHVREPTCAWDAVTALEQLGAGVASTALTQALSDRRTPAEAQLRAAGALLRFAVDDAQLAAAESVLFAALNQRKPHLRGLAVEQLADAHSARALAALRALRSHRRGRDHLDAIDEAIVKIEQRLQPAGGRP